MDDLADHAYDIAHWQTHALARHQRERERQRRIDESMRQSDPDAPRACRDCRQPIDPARVRALPFVSRCVACGELAEKFYRERAWLPR